jgi:hypothetical protein
MNLSKSIIFALSLVLTLASCSKEEDIMDSEFNTASQVEQFSDLQVSDNFDWNTSREVELTVNGLPTQLEINKLISVEDGSGNVLYTQVWKMSDTGKMRFSIPAHLSQINVRYGKIVKSLRISTNGLAEFSFAQSITDFN